MGLPVAQQSPLSFFEVCYIGEHVQVPGQTSWSRLRDPLAPKFGKLGPSAADVLWVETADADVLGTDELVVVSIDPANACGGQQRPNRGSEPAKPGHGDTGVRQRLQSGFWTRTKVSKRRRGPKAGQESGAGRAVEMRAPWPLTTVDEHVASHEVGDDSTNVVGGRVSCLGDLADDGLDRASPVQ
jgi:hypothetical protein